MRFSIRSLFALLLLVGLLVQTIVTARQTIQTAREVEQYEAHLASLQRRNEELDGRVKWLRQRTRICEEVLRDYSYHSEVYVAAEERFKSLQGGRADK